VFGECFAHGVEWPVRCISYLAAAERINRVLHATLRDPMLGVVADVRPQLMEECEITDLAALGP
jgi:hypothetical protein